MTSDDLLALLATSLSVRPQRVRGGFLFRHTPHVGEFAYLSRLYDPVSDAFARAWLAETDHPGNPYRAFVTEIANGLRFANISLHGVIGRIDRSVGHGIGQPISLDFGNLIERPVNLDETDMV